MDTSLSHAVSSVIDEVQAIKKAVGEAERAAAERAAAERAVERSAFNIRMPVDPGPFALGNGWAPRYASPGPGYPGGMGMGMMGPGGRRYAEGWEEKGEVKV